MRKTDYDRYNLNLKLHMMRFPKITIDATVKVSRLVSGSYSGSVDPFLTLILPTLTSVPITRTGVTGQI
ncbi:MAG: hypothetical protein ACLU4N_04795 [Butyricimonas faecihominis]